MPGGDRFASEILPLAQNSCCRSVQKSLLAIRHRVVSNPVLANQVLDRATLTIPRVNGNRLPPRMCPRNLSVQRIRAYLSNLTEVSPEDLKILKLCHHLLTDNMLVRGFATNRGQNHIIATIDSTNIGPLTANLFLEGPCEPPCKPQRALPDEWTPVEWNQQQVQNWRNPLFDLIPWNF